MASSGDVDFLWVKEGRMRIALEEEPFLLPELSGI